MFGAVEPEALFRRTRTEIERPAYVNERRTPHLTCLATIVGVPNREES